MDATVIIGFLALVALGSFIQTLSGFAIAMIIVGGATVFQLAPIAFTINIVSFVALANSLAAIHNLYNEIDKKILLISTAGGLLLSAPGLIALRYLSENAIRALEVFLGVFILASAGLLMFRPERLIKASANATHFLVGCLGGFLSGLLGAGGPPMVLHLYRQPLPFAVVRTTLLAFLGAMTAIRLCMEASVGHITFAMLYLGLLCVPASIIAALAARSARPRLPEHAMRRFALVLLCLLGVALIV